MTLHEISNLIRTCVWLVIIVLCVRFIWQSRKG